MRLDSVELQYDSVLSNSLGQKDLFIFYAAFQYLASLSYIRCQQSCKAYFECTTLCEQATSCMKQQIETVLKYCRCVLTCCDDNSKLK
jgi:hypothetical protein